jgi:hypothetical protein
LSKGNTKNGEQSYRLDDLANNNKKDILYQRADFSVQNKKLQDSGRKDDSGNYSNINEYKETMPGNVVINTFQPKGNQ